MLVHTKYSNTDTCLILEKVALPRVKRGSNTAKSWELMLNRENGTYNEKGKSVTYWDYFNL